MSDSKRTLELPFKARSHIFKLLGDELIGNDRLAVFELIKNSYDADATCVSVTLDLFGSKRAITVSDNGSGMSLDDIQRGWLEIGSAYKRGANKKRSPQNQRMPLGEKGVGRLASHKLGETLEIVTRKSDDKEIAISIHWPDLIADDKFLGDSKIKVFQRDKPEVFMGKTHGTRLIIRNLHKETWERGDVRALQRMIIGLISPFEAPDSFKVDLSVPKRDEWLADMFTVQDILAIAPWIFKFKIDEYARFHWDFEFRPPARFKTLLPRKLNSKARNEEHLPLRNDGPKSTHSHSILTKSDLDGIGPIRGSFFVYFRRKEVLEVSGHTKEIGNFLDGQTGVRIYRDGVRVFNYGEPEDDWLGLNAERINAPADKMGTRSVIGMLELDLDRSSQLREKTNREGFDENDAYERLKLVVRSIVSRLDNLRRPDRESIEKALKIFKDKANPQKFAKSLGDVRAAIKKSPKLESEISPKLDYIEHEYQKLTEIATTAGLAGMNLPLIFHEIEREVSRLNEAVTRGESGATLATRIRHIAQLLEGFTPLVKRTGIKTTQASKLISSLIDINEGRLKAHGVTVSAPLLNGEEPDFPVRGALNLYLSAMNNLIDNAIHWTTREREIRGGDFRPAIQIRSLTKWAEEGPCLAIIDNGPGFSIDPEDALRPFVSDRAGGMGLGLYFAQLVMELHGGNLMIVPIEDLDLERPLNGSAVVVRFGKSKEKSQ